jgi:hypothetical protein
LKWSFSFCLSHQNPVYFSPVSFLFSYSIFFFGIFPLEPVVNPTNQASLFRLQHLPYYANTAVFCRHAVECFCCQYHYCYRCCRSLI